MKVFISILFILSVTGLHISEVHLASSFPTGSVNIKSELGTYLTGCHDCGPAYASDSAGIYGTDPKNPLSIWNAQLIGDQVAFKSSTGKYLARCYGCWSNPGVPMDNAFVEAVTAFLWTPEDMGNGKWAFKGDNGKYLSRCYGCVPGSTQPDFAFVNAVTALNNPAAQWTVSPNIPTGPVNIKSELGTYLTRCRDCGPEYASDSAGIYGTDPNNLLSIWNAQLIGDKVAFKADTGKYLARCYGCWSNPVVPMDNAFVEATTAFLWTPEDMGNGKWALKGDNGKYLSRCYNCVPGSTHPDFAFVTADTALNNPTAQWTITPH